MNIDADRLASDVPARVLVVRDAGQIAAARAFARRQMRQWSLDDDPDLMDDVQVVVSELVSNAVAHARPPATLRLRRRDGAVLVEVDDNVPSTPGKPLAAGVATDDAGHGRGLAIVDELSASWGTEGRDGLGKTVHAALLTHAG